MNRLTTGHSNLFEHRWNMKIQDTTSPVCKCGKDNGSVEHYLLDCSLHEKHRRVLLLDCSLHEKHRRVLLLDCSLHEKHRRVLVSTILEIYRSSDIEKNLRIIDLVTLLGDNGHHPKSVRKDIKMAMCKFILDTSAAVLI